MGTIALTRQDVDAAEPLDWPAPAQQPRSFKTFTVEARYRGFAITVEVDGNQRDLDRLIDGLEKIGAEPTPTTDAQPVGHAGFAYTPDGKPICPKHGAPMKERNKQGDLWHSHAVAEDEKGNTIYCKGYAGKDSPGWEY